MQNVKLWFLLMIIVMPAQEVLAQPSPVTWGPIVQATNTTAPAYVPKVAVAGDTVHIVYVASGIRYRRSTDRGMTWGQDAVLMPPESTGATLYNRPLAAESSYLYVVCESRVASGGIRSIKLIRSTNSGETWSQPQILLLNENLGQNTAPMVAVSDSLVYVVFQTWIGFVPQLGLIRSRDYGATWDSIRVITSYPESHGDRGDIKAVGTTVHLVYGMRYEPSGREIFYISSTDNGLTWSDERPLSTVIDSYKAWEPDVDADERGNVVASWQDAKFGSTGFGGTILVRRSSDFGATWLPERNVNIIPSAVRSSISLSGTQVHILWDDERFGFGNQRVFYAMSDDFGDNWFAEAQASKLSEPSFDSDLASSKNSISCVWSNNVIMPAQVYYREGWIKTVSVDSKKDVRGENSVLAVYPNPLNNQGTIRYTLVTSMNVTISLYDILGREFRILNGALQGEGEHQVTLDVSAFATGVYMMTINLGDEKEVRRIVILK